MTDLKLGEKIIEGKTKIIYPLLEYGDGNAVLVQSKDRITAGDGARANDMPGKAAISTRTATAIFEFLSSAGIKTSFISKHSDTAFIATRCEMIPLEVVTRRVATGSYVRRNPGLKEGFRFSPLMLEFFYKDDANHDPQWSRAQILDADMTYGGVTLGRRELDAIGETAVAAFEVLEKALATRQCALIDMKIEFGVNAATKEIMLSDVIDNDSWRLWPEGDKRLMMDKQVYRNLKEVTPEALDQVKRNFEWVANEVQHLIAKPRARVVIFMGSKVDVPFSSKIKAKLDQLGVPTELRVSSAHKGTAETIQILREYESHDVPTVFIAVAGRSNGLGPVLSGNTCYPVINCPPVTPDWGSQDIWSSIRLPSGLGCTTTLNTDGAALAAAQILGMSDHMIWCRLRGARLNQAVALMKDDAEITS